MTVGIGQILKIEKKYKNSTQLKDHIPIIMKRQYNLVLMTPQFVYYRAEEWEVIVYLGKFSIQLQHFSNTLSKP